MSPDEIKICTSTNFNKSRQHIADGIVHVASDLREYWPLTVPQIFYQLVAALIIPNKHSEYRNVSEIGTKLRTLGALLGLPLKTAPGIPPPREVCPMSGSILNPKSRAS